MKDSKQLLLPEEYEMRVCPEEDSPYNDDPVEVLEFILLLIKELLERVIPDPKRELTLQEAGQCLSILGKIWNLTECHEEYDNDSVKCQTYDEKLLDMEGYVEEYQYLHMEAVDRALTDIRIIPQHFVWLLSVDISGNRLTNVSACPLTKLPNLVSLKINRNRIVDPYLQPMKHLQYLGLSSNKIETLHRIYHPNLLKLDVSWNMISNIDGKDCWKLKHLEQLELRGNRLKTTSGIQYQYLVSLYLAENRITELKGLHYLPNLQIVHLRKNPLSDLTGFTPINTKLTYLNLRSCKVESLEELKKLQVLKGLTVLVVKDNLFNPFQEAEDREEEIEPEDDDMRIQILTMIPQLKRIDKKIVTREEQKAAKEMQEEQKIDGMSFSRVS